MCGRFSLTGDIDFYAEYFGVADIVTDPIKPSWNVAPTDPVYVINERAGVRQLDSMRWGLVPHWATDTKSIHINARSETVATPAAFRDSFARKRCLIPADGFYEWELPERGRNPHWVHRADGYPMVFAGIWASRLDPETKRWHRTCSIITTAAYGVISSIHDRMPVSLIPEVWSPWVDREITDPEAALELLQPIDPENIQEHMVSRKVNAVHNNGPELLNKSDTETLF